MNLPLSTVFTVIHNADNIKKTSLSAIGGSATRHTRLRHPHPDSMEDMLCVWVKDCNQHSILLSTSFVCEKALALWGQLGNYGDEVRFSSKIFGNLWLISLI